MKKYYFEFDKNEYYGLVTVSVDENDTSTIPHVKATEIYVTDIADITVEEALKEGAPVERTKEYAFTNYVEAPNQDEDHIPTLVKRFNEYENEAILVDGSLY